MKKNSKKKLAAIAQNLTKGQRVEASKSIAIKGGSQGVSTFDLVL